MTAMCLGDLGWRFPIVHARVYLDEALAIWRELGDWRAALPLDGLGRLAHAEGDPRAAQALLEETVGWRARLTSG